MFYLTHFAHNNELMTKETTMHSWWKVKSVVRIGFNFLIYQLRWIEYGRIICSGFCSGVLGLFYFWFLGWCTIIKMKWYGLHCQFKTYYTLLYFNCVNFWIKKKMWTIVDLKICKTNWYFYNIMFLTFFFSLREEYNTIVYQYHRQS